MSDETIRPALSPDQWRWWLGPTVNLSLSIDGACDRVGYDLHLSRGALIALANAARPDDDPGKLTREDLAWVREACDALFAYAALDEAGGGLPAGFPKDAPAAEQVSILQGERLAAKLAALLPPEGA